MEDKKGEVFKYRARLDKSLASPELTNHATLKGLVRDQMLQSRLDENEGCSEDLLEKRTGDVSNFLDMLRSASDNGNEPSKTNEPPSGDWKVKDNNHEYRVMYRPGLQGTPFHTLLVEGYVDGPVDACLCIGWESALYRKCVKRLMQLEALSYSSLLILLQVATDHDATFQGYGVQMLEKDPNRRTDIFSQIPDLESIDINSHGYTKDGIPEAEDVVRADLVGGFALQKVTSTRSYFRTIATVDLKLDFVPPALINFISRQLIGSGFKLYQKVVTGLCKKDDKEYVQALEDPFYVRIREAIYAANGQHQIMEGKGLLDSTSLPPNDHSITPGSEENKQNIDEDDIDESLPERLPTEQKKAVNEIEECETEENGLLTSEHKDEKNGLAGEILLDDGLLVAEMYSSDEISENGDEGIGEASTSTIRIAEKGSVKSKKNVALNPEVKQALETLEKAIFMVRNSKTIALERQRPTVIDEETSNLEKSEKKDSSSTKDNDTCPNANDVSTEAPPVNARPVERTSHASSFTARHSGSNSVTREPNHKKVAPASPEPRVLNRAQVSSENVNGMNETTLLDQMREDDAGYKLVSRANGNGLDNGEGMKTKNKKKKQRWFASTGSHSNGLQQRGKKNSRLCCFVPGSGSVKSYCNRSLRAQFNPMKHLIRMGLQIKRLSPITSPNCSSRAVHLSSLFRSPRKSNSPSKGTSSQHAPESNHGNINSLFQQITEILGADEVIPDRNPVGICFAEKTEVGNKGSSQGMTGCTPDVCENAQERKNTMLVSEDLPASIVDISPSVRQIADAVRAEDGATSMEERLERIECRFDVEVVEEVLKRCSEVPHLALRFFDWVSNRDGFRHTTDTYNMMLYVAGEAQELGLLDRLADDMNENIVERDFKTWTILISQYGKGKKLGKVLMCFEQMKKSGLEPDAQVYKMVIETACDAGKGEIALELYKEMVLGNMEVDLSLYEVLLDSLAKLGDSEAVNLIADDMTRVSQIPERDVYLCVLKSYCVAGRIREALELIRDLKDKGVPLDLEYFETLVKGLCIADRVGDALEIIEIMKKRNLDSGKVYDFVISAHLRRKELSKAFDLFESMKQSGFSPTTSTYTELIQHLFNSDEYEKGCRLYAEITERGLDVDSVAIMAVVAGHIHHNHLSEAWEVFRSMENKGIEPAWKHYNEFIKELCRVSRTDEVLKVMHEMQELGMSINHEIFEWVISCMERNGEVENVEKVNQLQRTYRLGSPEDASSANDDTSTAEVIDVKRNRKPQFRSSKNGCLVKPIPSAYSKQDLQEVSGIVSSSGDWSHIEEALEKCDVKFTPDLVLEVLRNCSIHGNKALNFFSWVGKQAGYSHTAETYNMAMKVSGRGKDFKHMRSLFHEMKRKRYSVSPDTWTIMIMQYGRTGLTKIALEIFEEMKTSGSDPTESTYKHLIICLCEKKGRQVDEAMKLFQEMIRAGFVPDREIAETYLRCLCESGKLLEARRCIKSLCKVGFSVPFSRSLYIRALCRIGKLDEAISLLDKTWQDQKLTLDRSTHGSLVHGLLRAGRTEEAFAKLDSMKESGIRPTSHVYTSLIVHFFKEKQPEKAMETLEKMQQEGCKPSIVTHSAMIRGYMNLGRTPEAWSVFRRLKQDGPSPDFQTYSMFISCLCKAEESEQALQLLSEMLESKIVPSAYNFREVFFGLNREGKQDLAQGVLQQKWDLIRKRKFLT
ncbi:Putative pentatricopeptide repeat-containing protein At5g06400, mitochondrial [Linum perenne]